MLSSIHPLGERARNNPWWLTVGAFTLASVTAGSMVGAALGLLGTVPVSGLSDTARLAAIAGLARAGIPVRVNVAPVIPGLNDHEIPAILKAAAEAGARAANAMLVRLPFSVKDLFVDWLRKDHPLRADRVIQAIRSVRGGRLSETRFSIRHKGEGVRAEAIFDMFAIHCRRLGLSTSPEPLATHHFRIPGEDRQLSLGLEEMD